MPKVGLPAVFVVCMVSATLLPLGSEPAVFGYIKLNPDLFWPTVLVATAGNALGGMVNYWLAYGTKSAIGKHTHTPRALAWFESLGPKALFFSFLPLIGDPLTAVAGWLKMPWWPCFYWQLLGKFTRYTVATAILMYIPNTWWAAGFEVLKNLF